MRKISDTILRLATLRSRQAANVTGIISSGPLSPLRNFRSNPGALQAQFYLPDGLAEGAPLVVVLHGCTQTAAGYDQMSGWSRLADDAGFALLYPEQQRANNPNLCFNWFKPEDTARDGGEASSIREMIEAMIVTHKVDRRRIFVTGLSAGGAMAAAMLATYPEVFAGGGIIAGLPYGSATTIPEAFDRMRGHGGPSERDLKRLLQRASSHAGPWPKISIWQGSADHMVSPSNASAIASQWRGVHGLAEAPTHVTTAGPHSKQVWRDGKGNVAIEINTISGMGHGTPLDENLGEPGPYMLDVGISSTREIARFWGIMGKSISCTTNHEAAAVYQQSMLHRLDENRDHKATCPQRDGIHESPRPTASYSNGPKKIIADALRAAGLMR